MTKSYRNILLNSIFLWISQRSLVSIKLFSISINLLNILKVPRIFQHITVSFKTLIINQHFNKAFTFHPNNSPKLVKCATSHKSYQIKKLFKLFSILTRILNSRLAVTITSLTTKSSKIFQFISKKYKTFQRFVECPRIEVFCVQ